MTDFISLTIPLTPSALDRAQDMLHGLKIDLEKGDTTKPVTIRERGEQFTEAEIDEAMVDLKKPVVLTDNSAKSIFTAPPSIDEQIAAQKPTVAENVTELDADGLPWDVRIHSKNKSTLSKTKQWKKKRGVDPVLVATVEAELRALMDIPVVVTDPVHNAENGVPVITSITAPPPPPAPLTQPASVVMTFPELMAKITGAGLTPESVTLVLQKHAIAAMPLLAARPDLVPVISAELFPNG